MAEIPRLGLLADIGKHYTPPPPSQQEYYQRVGEFIIAYAQAECVILELARKLSGLKEDKARVIFHGMRGTDLKNRILATIRLGNRSKAVKGDIESCLQHFDVIGMQRDKLVHRSVAYDGGTLKITNEMTAKSMLEYEQDLLSMADMLSMLVDCLKITIRLSHVSRPALRRDAPKDFVKTIHGPWLYKFVPPKTRKKPSHKALMIAALLNQPRASQP